MAHSCETCWMRRRAEARPNGLLARLWRWHTTWCPGWKAYQKSLAEAGATKADTTAEKPGDAERH